jgi:formate-dependent nitrite reductase membrane component NrfD
MATDDHAPITASTGVQSTYYGKPIIKPPHWRWLIITYFFLGGLAGGEFIIGAVNELVRGDRAVSRAARYISVAALIPSPLLLILDLGRPERFLNMLRIVKLRSPMSIGSWALTVLSTAAGLAAMLQFVSDVFHRDVPPKAHRIIGIAGLPFGAFLCGYTGVLLAATNVPIWARFFPLMGPTFVTSAFSNSFAAISLFLGFGKGEREDTAQKVARAEAICLTAELTLLTAGVIRTGKLGRPLTRGKLGLIFWPVTYAGGIVLPLILQLSGPVQGKAGSRSRRTVTALITLIGGYAFRALIIFAGRESARRPEDYLEFTKMERG